MSDLKAAGSFLEEDKELQELLRSECVTIQGKQFTARDGRGFRLLADLEERGYRLYMPIKLADVYGITRQAINNGITRGHLVTIEGGSDSYEFRYVVLDKLRQQPAADPEGDVVDASGWKQARIDLPEEPAAAPAPADPDADLLLGLRLVGFGRDEAKLLLAGFCLVRSQDKVVQFLSPAYCRRGWSEAHEEEYPSIAAAERAVKKALEDQWTIHVTSTSGEPATYRDWNILGKQGFKWFRRDDLGLRIKDGTRNWSTWSKYETEEALRVAWDELLKDPKHLEG